jgi:hypothetical protein
MKPINVFSLILSLQLFGCAVDNPRLSFYKIEDFYVGTYRLNANASNMNLNEDSVFLKEDSLFIGLSFKISFCDSTGNICKYGWHPTRGSYGIVNKIKRFYILHRDETNRDTIQMTDLKLVLDSVSFVVRQPKNVEAMANSINRKGCRASFDEFIRRINAGDVCYIDNSLSSTYPLYYLNAQRLSNGQNELVFCFEFQDYLLKKNISIRRGGSVSD